MTRRTFHTTTLASGLAFARNAPAQTATSRPKIKIGQIGTRHAHAGGQFAAMRATPDFEVVGVVEPDEARRKKVEKDEDFAGVKWLTEEQLLNTPGLQAVGVETEVCDLLGTAQKVVDAGLHLHLDKPAGESLPQFKRVLDTATAKKRLVKMGYMFRYNPAFQIMIRAVREGWIGDVMYIHAEMSKKLTDDGRKDLLRYPGGSMFELGCHIIDSVHRVLGVPKSVTPHIQKGADGLADNMLAVLDYAHATATVRSAIIEPDGGPRRQFIVCGTKGSCEIRPLEPPAMTLTIDALHDRFKKGTQEVPLEKAPRYAADWIDFAKAIRGEIEWEFKPEHDLAVQETVLRASGLKTT
jgi:predicted dehydrogenase